MLFSVLFISFSFGILLSSDLTSLKSIDLLIILILISLLIELSLSVKLYPFKLLLLFVKLSLLDSKFSLKSLVLLLFNDIKLY